MGHSVLRLWHCAATAGTGLSRSTIDAKIANGDFPARTALGARGVASVHTAIDGGITSCIDAREQNAAKGRTA